MLKNKGIIAAAAVALSLIAGIAVAQDGKGTQGYVTDTRNAIVKDPYDLCWRTGYWTPAIANCECDKDLLPRQVCEPPAPRPAAAPPPPPAKAPAPKPTTQKVTFAADVLFDFDKAVLKPEGKAKLDELVTKLKGIALEVIIAIGHTDRIGSKEYNQKLSVRRAESVKAHLVSKGIEANRIYTEGKGEHQPVADNKTKEGRAQNRRVEVEVVGTRTVQQ